MLSVVHSYWVHGVDGQPVRVEVNVQKGLPLFTVVGLPAGAVREGKERVFAALSHVGRPVPPRRVTVNLSPADMPKAGSGFDLPIAVGLLVATGQVPPEAVAGSAFVGELGLDGSLRSIRGAIALAMAAAEAGCRALFVPAPNVREATAVPGVDVRGASTVEQLVAHLQGGKPLQAPPRNRTGRRRSPSTDLTDVRGQGLAKRALVVAAAGGHNLLMTGPPGAGKTMLARRLPGLLPPLSDEEALDVTRVHSVAGLLDPVDPVSHRRPFRAPHHTISAGGLIGGGNPPRPGEISLAHRGVLFLDELPEFRRSVLETLRQPIESGVARIARVRHAVSFPSIVQLVAAMNPCPCGLPGDDCLCHDREIHRYRSRISGPLLDRIDIRIRLEPLSWSELVASPPRVGGPDSAAARNAVIQARTRQATRQTVSNARIPPREVMARCRPTRSANRLLGEAVGRFGISARGVHGVLRLARTIADLAGREHLDEQAVAEALHLRAGAGRDGTEGRASRPHRDEGPPGGYIDGAPT